MGLDIDALVAPVSEDQPSGPDMYGDFDRQEVELAFEKSVSGDGTETADDVDWRGICNKVIDQAGKTRDLWLPVYLMRAAALAGDLELVADGAELLARLVEDRWEDVHPQLDELGFIGRKTPVESLTRNGEFLFPLQRFPLVSHSRLGRFTGADFQRFMDEGSSAEGFGMFRALIDATPPDDLQVIADRVGAIRDAIRRADVVMTDNAEGDTSTNFVPTYQVLDKLRQSIKVLLPATVQDAPAGGDDDWSAGDPGTGQGGGGTVRPAAGPAFSGSIQSRDDVRRAIDSICDYYARFEPASPVPFALRRAKEWISLDFLSVLEDIAPNGMAEAGTLLTSKLVPEGAGTSSSSNDGWSSGAGQAAETSSDDGWGSGSSSSSSDSGW